MKKSSVNTFTEGLVCDLDPINVPNNVLTDCLNGTIITYDDNEFSLQNDKGNYPLKDCKLRPNFIPVGIKEHGGILYIVSLNPLTGEEEIGSYPSPKLYDGGTPHGDVNIEYVIDKAFEEANSEELDYSELESKCKSWYYSDPKLKLNVGDKFWFEEELENTNFEKIEKYIIDENSIPHCISNDWLNNSLEYTSPISGTIMLKNKIFEFANSSAETNTFTCWPNERNLDPVPDPAPDLENSYINVQDVNNVLGEICLIYNSNGNWITINNPSEPGPAITSQYITYDAHKLTIHSDTHGYYITSTGSDNYFLCYDPNNSYTGLSFSLNPSDNIYWNIDDRSGCLRIRPVTNQTCSISYHSNMIRCDAAGAGCIQIIKKSPNSESEKSYYKLVTTNPSDWTGTYIITFNSKFALVEPRSDENPEIDNLIVDDILVGSDNYAFNIEKYSSSYYLISNSSGYLWYDQEDSELELGKSVIDAECLWLITMNEGKVRISPMLDADYSIQWSEDFDTDIRQNDNIILYKKDDNFDENYDSDIFINNITSLFSFTHKLYIDDNDTLQWLTNDYLKYKVNLKVNDSIIYSNTFDGNSLISDSKTFGEYEIAIESRQASNLEWYSNNKIIAKYFVTVIKNIDSNDQISAEIIPIVSISDTKNIIMSQFAKPLNNSVSEYTSTTWTIGEEYYRFYNHPIDNVYKTQYIELDIKGPIEASDDFLLKCEICQYGRISNVIYTTNFTPGIGKSVLQIDYNNLFIKEDVYTVKYSIVLSGTNIKTIVKPVITSELFNYNEFLTYKDYSLIPNDVWMSKYVNTINWGSIRKTNHQFIKNLPNSKYAWINNKEDIYLKSDLPALFIHDSDYLAYINKFNDELIEGTEYSFNFDLITPRGLTGNLWNCINSYECADQLGKCTEISSENFTISIPIGVCQKLNMTPVSEAVWGPVESIDLITPSEYGKLYITGITEPVLDQWDNEYYVPGPTIIVSHNDSVLGRHTSSWSSMGEITSKIKPFFNNLSGLNNVTEFRFGANGINGLWAECSLNGTQMNGSRKFYLCQSDNGAFGWIPVNDYYAVNADKECKYKSGVWYNMLKNGLIDFSTPNLKINIKFQVVCHKLGVTSTFNNSYVWIDNDSWSNNFDIDSKFDDLSSNANKHFTHYNSIKDLITVEPETYIKGIISNKSYYDRLCEHYRMDDKIIVSGNANGYLSMYWYQFTEGDGEMSNYDHPLGSIYIKYA